MSVRSEAPPAGAPAWAGWGSGALAVGAVVAIDPVGWAPFGPAKWLVVSVFGFGAAAVLLWTGRVSLQRRSLIAWLVILVLLGLGALTGGDVATALLGQPDRHLGWITWLLCLLVFAGGQQLDCVDAQRVAVRGATLGSLWLGVWAVWEMLAGPPIALVAETSRLTGPFGSAAFLGAAACLFVPLAAGGAFDRAETRVWRVLAAVGVVTGVLALIGSGSRAAWFGALVGAVVVVLRVRPSRRTMLLGAAGAAVVLLVLSPWLRAVTERSAGATSRLDEWAVAGRVIADHPVVGVGPEGYRIAVPDGIDRHYERTYGRDVVLPDRAHSGPLDVALAGGVPAAIVYLGLVGFVCWRALGLIRRASPLLAGAAVGLVAYSVQQLLLFPLAEIDPVWWLFAGVVVTASTKRPPAHYGEPRWHRVPAAFALVLAVVALIAGTLDVAADRLAKQALDASAAGGVDLAVERAERAVALRPDNARYRMVVAEVLARRGTLADIDAALAQTRRALDWSAHDPLAVDREASLLLDRAAITGADSDVEAALAAWGRLVGRDPMRARWQLQYGRAAALAGDLDLARRAWATAADLSPRDDTASSLLAQLGTGG